MTQPTHYWGIADGKTLYRYQHQTWYIKVSASHWVRLNYTPKAVPIGEIYPLEIMPPWDIGEDAQVVYDPYSGMHGKWRGD